MTKDKKYDLESLKEVFQLYLVEKSPIDLPDSAKETILKLAPILIIIGLIICVPMILAGLGLTALALPFAAAGGVHFGWYSIMSLLTSAAFVVASVIILPGISKRTKKTWNALYYLSLAEFVLSILSLNIGGAIVGGIISFWILFQLRNKFVN